VADGQQRHLRRPAVPAVGGLLADLRADAHPESDAWLAVHARRLFRRHPRRRLPGRRLQFLARGDHQRLAGGGVRRADRAPVPAPPPGRAAGPGAGDLGHLLHDRRSLPDVVGRRPDLGRHAARARRIRSLRPAGVSDLSPGHHPDRGGRRRRALAHARPHAARRDDPRRRRRSRDGAGGGHPRLAAVDHRVRAGRRTRGVRRHHRRPDPVGLSGPRPGHAAAGARGRDPGRNRQPARLVRRQHGDRPDLQFRPGAAARARLFRPFPSDAAGVGPAPARPVRQAAAMTGRHAALGLALLALAALPYWVAGIYYVNVASQILLYAVFALGLNVLVGYAGLVSLGHAGLFGLSCYAVAYLLAAGQGHVVAILAGLVITMIGTAMFAALSLRATGIGFIMITLALGEILWGLAYRWISITNGDNGINVAARP